MTKMIIEVINNGIHSVASVNVEDLQVDDIEVLKQITMIIEEYNKKQVELA